MDKLRALQYFVAAAQDGSFSAAARRFEVSVPAVAKLIGALERELGVRLLDRSRQGLTLTARGALYRETCGPLLAQLEDADRTLQGRTARQPRTLAVGAPPLLSRNFLVPALAAFHEACPELHVDLRTVDPLNVTNAQTRGLDMLIALGWPSGLDLILRPLARSRLIVCASPAYWQRHGRPQVPADLARHSCPLVRSPEGTVLDLWRHSRGSETQEVVVRGWLTCASRDDVLQAVLLGHGVGRFADLSVWPFVREGHLEPVLLDWQSRDSPPFSALFHPDSRHDAALQALVGFVAESLARVEDECKRVFGPRPPSARPAWYSRRQGRASAGRG